MPDSTLVLIIPVMDVPWLLQGSIHGLYQHWLSPSSTSVLALSCWYNGLWLDLPWTTCLHDLHCPIVYLSDLYLLALLCFARSALHCFMFCPYIFFLCLAQHPMSWVAGKGDGSELTSCHLHYITCLFLSSVLVNHDQNTNHSLNPFLGRL